MNTMATSEYFCPHCGEFSMQLKAHLVKCQEWQVVVPYVAYQWDESIKQPTDIPPLGDRWMIWGTSPEKAAEYSAKKFDSILYELLSTGDASACELVAQQYEGAVLLVRVLAGGVWKNFYVKGWLKPEYDASSVPPTYWKETQIIQS